MFDTISEFNAAIGTCSFGIGFTAGGGGTGFTTAGVGLFEVEACFVEDLIGFEVFIGGGAFVCAGNDGGGLGTVEVGVCFESFEGSAAGGAVLGNCSRSPFNIFDDSGDTDVLTVGFAGAGGSFDGDVVETPDGLDATFRAAAELAMGLDIGFSATGGFADVDALAVAVFGPAFVDFALVVVFFVVSGTSTSTGSEMTFLGLPLFFTASEDMLTVELGWAELS